MWAGGFPLTIFEGNVVAWGWSCLCPFESVPWVFVFSELANQLIEVFSPHTFDRRFELFVWSSPIEDIVSDVGELLVPPIFAFL